jgi:hypothetical protein
MYDIIGDIHGHADELVELLNRLGYKNSDGTYRHPTRTAVFVGDFIDRGPQIREVLGLVRPMCESESALAVMGNHEFNALAYHTPDPANRGQCLREQSEKNVKQHAATVRQVPNNELKDYLEWFRKLPMWLTLNGLRIVHACWDDDQMAVIDAARNAHGGVSTEFLWEATNRGTQLFDAIEDVLKGKEVELPDGQSYHDKDGHRLDCHAHQVVLLAGGPHALNPGEWTDDTSMALALADSITTVGWDLNDQARRYVSWWRNGEYSVNGRCFDIGITTRAALSRFERSGDARTAGDPSERPAETVRSCDWPPYQFASSTTSPIRLSNWRNSQQNRVCRRMSVRNVCQLAVTLRSFWQA